MDKFSHIYLVGCSYMNSYVATRPHDQLRNYFGGEISDITYAGTGYDYHERELFNAILEDSPKKALVIFGLSYWHRFELSYREGNHIKYMQFNPSTKMNEHNYGKHNPELGNLPENILIHRTFNAESYIENILRRLITLSTWLKFNNHKYIIFNQTDNNFIKFLNKNSLYKDYFDNDAGFIDLHEFMMLDWLKNNDVEFDIDLHPSTKPITGQIWTKFFIDYYEKNLV